MVVTETNLLIILNDDTYIQRHHLDDENNFKFDLLAQSGIFCFGTFIVGRLRILRISIIRDNISILMNEGQQSS